MSFGTTNGHTAGNGNGTGDGAVTDYTPIWPMVPGTRRSASRWTASRSRPRRARRSSRPAASWASRSRPVLRAEAGPLRRLPHLRVEVEGRDGTPISCGTTIEEGMVITTHSERVIENRRMVLELIFSDHDAYCLPPCQFKCPTRVDSPAT